MKVAVVGATGWLGGAVAQEAERRGHQVTALSRSGAPVAALAGAETVAVDVTDIDALADAVSGHDVVVVSVTDRSTPDRSIIPAAAQAALSALARAGVGRLAFVGGGGSLLASPGMRFVDSPAFPAEYGPEALAQADALAILRNDDSGTDWTYLSPPPHNLVPGERTGTYRVQAGDAPVTDADGHFGITSGDLASALLDELESPQFTRQRFTAGY
jgi:putative NADH-flavin reductase